MRAPEKWRAREVRERAISEPLRQRTADADRIVLKRFANVAPSTRARRCACETLGNVALNRRFAAAA
eukprot:787296-Lingulodinium_polyedra.AAC.1